MAAIDVHQVCAKLHVGRGDFEAAVGHLDAARRLTVKTVDPQYRAELRAREAELALWRGDPAEARAAVAAGLHDWSAPTMSGSSVRCSGSAAGGAADAAHRRPRR